MNNPIRARVLFWDGGRVITVNDSVTVSSLATGPLDHLRDLECVDQNFTVGGNGRTGKFATEKENQYPFNIVWKPMLAHKLSFEFRAALKLMGVEI